MYSSSLTKSGKYLLPYHSKAILVGDVIIQDFKGEFGSNLSVLYCYDMHITKDD